MTKLSLEILAKAGKVHKLKKILEEEDLEDNEKKLLMGKTKLEWFKKDVTSYEFEGWGQLNTFFDEPDISHYLESISAKEFLGIFTALDESLGMWAGEDGVQIFAEIFDSAPIYTLAKKYGGDEEIKEHFVHSVTAVAWSALGLTYPDWYDVDDYLDGIRKWKDYIYFESMAEMLLDRIEDYEEPENYNEDYLTKRIDFITEMIGKEKLSEIAYSKLKANSDYLDWLSKNNRILPVEIDETQALYDKLFGDLLRRPFIYKSDIVDPIRKKDRREVLSDFIVRFLNKGRLDLVNEILKYNFEENVLDSPKVREGITKGLVEAAKAGNLKRLANCLELLPPWTIDRNVEGIEDFVIAYEAANNKEIPDYSEFKQPSPNLQSEPEPAPECTLPESIDNYVADGLTVYMMIGSPGSGKSIYIKDHIKDGEVIASNDLIEKGNKKKKKIKLMGEALEQGKNVWNDDTNAIYDTRKELIDIAREYGAKVVGIHVVTDKETCLEWNKSEERVKEGKAQHKVVLNTYWARVRDTPPKAEEFDHFIEVDPRT